MAKFAIYVNSHKIGEFEANSANELVKQAENYSFINKYLFNTKKINRKISAIQQDIGIERKKSEEIIKSIYGNNYSIKLI